MSHRELNYTELYSDEEQRRENALRDTAEWLGTERFHAFTVMISTPITKKSGRVAYRSPSNIRIVCSFLGGFEGYPVEVMIRRYHPRYIRLFGVDGKGKGYRG